MQADRILLLLILLRMIIQDIMKIRFNPKDAQFEFKTPLERTTFEKYYPIPPNTQMEIKIDFINSIRQRQRPEVKLSYIKL
jgi:hypothetical protein